MTKKFDAVIVGGGVVGALVAKILSEAGKRVLILEAGVEGAMEPANYQEYLQTLYTEGGIRGTPNGPYPWNAAAPSPGIYLAPPNAGSYYIYKTQQHFMSDYLRMLGGTTLHWQGTSLRMVPNDFKMNTVYGKGKDWPLSYDDLEPAYRRAEYELGVSADVDDQLKLEFAGWYAKGYVYPMHKLPSSKVDQFFKRVLKNKTVSLEGKNYPLTVVGIPVGRNSTPNEKYNDHKGYSPAPAIADKDKGLRCQGNSCCMPICPVQAKYSALRTLHEIKHKSKELVIIKTQSVASKLIINADNGNISGVEYKLYKNPGSKEYSTEIAKGSLIVLAGNAIENAKLLLASGAAKTSGQVGCNLMDHPYLYAWGYSHERVFPFRGPDTTSGVESLRDGAFRSTHASFRASLSNWGWSGEPVNQINTLLKEKMYGKKFRTTLGDRMTRMVKIGFMFEQLPLKENCVTIDKEYKDELGNYKPVLSYGYDPYSLKGAEAAINQVWKAITTYGNIDDQTSYPTPAPPGYQPVVFNDKNYNLMGSGHIVGTHCMGFNKYDSVTDKNMKCWDHSNLYVVGAGNQVTIGTANPTLTTAALSIRAAEAMLKQLI